jgi:TolB-like protein
LAELETRCRVELLGPFRLLKADGSRIDVASRKGQALLAMLAVSGGGERTRNWLQEKLWGSRAQEQAQASLRNMLSALRSTLSGAGLTLLHSDHSRVWIDLKQVRVDARSIDTLSDHVGDFLEGLDIPGEDAFEDWLRDERARMAELIARRPIMSTPAKESAIELPIPTPQFGELPALAVLPFVNLTGDPSKDIFGDGISEDLIDRLSRLRWLPIIARSSSFGFRGRDIDPKTLGAQLGARYLLDGRVRDDAGQLAIAASLTDTQSGQVVWSNKQILGDGSPAVLQELLTGYVLTLGARIDLQEQNRVVRSVQSDLNVRELIWRGRWHLNRFTREDALLANACFSKALEQEPNSPEAIIQMTNALLWDAWALRGNEDAIRAVRQMAQKAIIADYDDARGHMIAGIAECFLRQPIRAEALLRRAIDLNPSLFLAHGYLGSSLYLNDNPKAALESLNFAIRLSPNDQHLFQVLGEVAISHLMLGENEKAIEAAESSTLRRSAYWFAHVSKINALVKLGNMKGARDAHKTLKAASPQFDESYIDWIPFCDRRWNIELKKGLNQAAAQSD